MFLHGVFIPKRNEEKTDERKVTFDGALYISVIVLTLFILLFNML